VSRAAALAVTLGDPAGVGTEITIGAWQRRNELPPFFLLDDPDRVRVLADATPVVAISAPDETFEAFERGLPVLPHPVPAPVRSGVPNPANAEATISAIERAVAFALAGDIAGVVTNPINKKALQDGAGFAHPGHTEFLAGLAGVDRTVMMLAAPGLRVVPVTIHIPLADVPDALTRKALMETLEITHSALQQDFGMASPRIAVAGLNHHAGEGGAMGKEEIALISPALDEMRDAGLQISGPLPADTMFHPAARERYDVAVCMYHDQALVPLKMLDFARGVNVTLGLPFVRTSPDHGTAYDIAGKGIADPSSMIEAIGMAGELSLARRS
jgi:4-hydroxythreonine-4-phosphate dehydrogenase